MSLFDDASLVYIPTGYKATKNYSGKPSTGGADMTFSRASGATRVNSKGLVEKVRTNLLTYSEDFSTSAGWSASGSVSATANYGTAPNGTNTSTQIVFTGGSQIWRKTVSGINGNLGVFSLWIKGVAGETIVVTYGGTDKVLTLTGNWTRFYTNGNIASSAELFINTFASVTARTIEVWGGQAEVGSVATDYIPTTTAAVSVGPVNDEPRLTYDPVNPTAPSLLMEPQRTNIALYSEDFNNAVWNKQLGASVTANTNISPDGYKNADTLSIQPNQYIFQSSAGNLPSGTTYTFSAYVKVDSGTKQFQMFTYSGTGNDFTSPTFTATTEWQRFTLTFTTATAAVTGFYPVGQDGFAGGDFIVWGAQVEVGSYPTSYIPTNGTSVTRVADLSQKTGASDIIGQTEGTIYWEADFTTMVATAHEDILNIDNGAFGNTIYLFKSSTGLFVAEIYVSSVLQASFSTPTKPIGTYKMALGYANNNTAFFVNGEQVGATDTSCSIPATNRIQLGNGALGPSTSNTKKVLLFPTRLDNATLATLTSL